MAHVKVGENWKLTHCSHDIEDCKMRIDSLTLSINRFELLVFIIHTNPSRPPGPFHTPNLGDCCP